MNVFFLDENPVLAAQYQCDKHVVKMILESAQLLCTSHWELDTGVQNTDEVKFYRATHKNHPCSIWVRENRCNYHWLSQHAIALCMEYTYRYGKKHASFDTIMYCSQHNPVECNNYVISPPAQAMPDEFKCDDTVQAYRDYYWHDKRVNIDMRWAKGRDKPDWWKELELQDFNQRKLNDNSND